MPDRLKRELLDFPEDQRIRRVFTWAIISKLLAAGRLSEAREELKTLKQEFPEGKGLAVGLQNMIEIYEQRTDMLRKQGRLRPETKQSQGDGCQERSSGTFVKGIGSGLQYCNFENDV